jgi:hypothetical protein
LIAGTTGSETELARTIIAPPLHQKPRDTAALFDPKFHGLVCADLPHLLFPIVSDPREILERLTYLVNEMERRDREQIARPRIVVVVDELADVIETGGKEIESALTRLVQRGRSAGMSVIACTQKPTVRAVAHCSKRPSAGRTLTSAEDSECRWRRRHRKTRAWDFLLITGGRSFLPPPRDRRLTQATARRAHTEIQESCICPWKH